MLEDASLHEFVDSVTLARLRALHGLSQQKIANLLRLYLLGTHGGVWADATCFCSQPLDEWLAPCMRSGFFAFRRRADTWLNDPANSGWLGLFRRSGDRIINNWFLASVQENPLAVEFFRAHLAFFEENDFSLRDTPSGAWRVNALSRVINRNPRLSQLWTRPFLVKHLRDYPYFIFHYHFASFVSDSSTAREIWRRTPVFIGNRLNRLKRDMLSPMTPGILRRLQDTASPVHKLTWRYNEQDCHDGCVLAYLISTVDQAL